MITVLLIVLGIAVAAGLAWWVWQGRLVSRPAEPDERLPLFSARATDGLRPPPQQRMTTGTPPDVAMLRRGRLEVSPTAATPPHNRTVPPTPAAAVDDGGVAEAAVRANGTGPAETRPAVPASSTSPLAPAPATRAPFPAAEPPMPGTIQFLPGRLEVLAGRGIAEQEVRFVRPPRAGQAAEVTFGRGEGPPFSHVQLRAPTVSRLHARLVQQGNGSWALENLSNTNPVVVNGEELPRGAPPRPLHDGDRLEMGEVVFRFHAR
jgi:hypothetical protein